MKWQLSVELVLLRHVTTAPGCRACLFICEHFDRHAAMRVAATAL